MASYPKAWIARVKGALLAGFKPKQLAHWTGIPVDTIKEWARDDRRGCIEADQSVREDIRLALLKEN